MAKPLLEENIIEYEAAEGRFFHDQESLAKEIIDSSHEFAFQHQDLLSNGYGIVFQRVSEQGNQTLMFDILSSQYKLLWSLTTTMPRGRVVEQLMIDNSSELIAKKTVYNHTGTSDAVAHQTDDEAEDHWHRIKNILATEEYTREVEQKRIQISKNPTRKQLGFTALRPKIERQAQSSYQPTLPGIWLPAHQ